MEENIRHDFELLKRIVAPKSSIQALPVDVSRVQKIIQEDIPNTLGKLAPPEFPALYFEFGHVFEKFHDFLLFDKLIGKNIIALGGGFSSGKSSLLNAILGKKILPAQIDPTTTVPTYVLHDSEERAMGINQFDVKLPLDIPDLKSITHGFGSLNDGDEMDGPQPSQGDVTLGHLLKSLFVAVPYLPFERTAFLDTPGYSKPDSDAYSARTDERIARAQLNSSDYILWCVPADAGMITANDLAFLGGLDKSIPKLIVITKADKAPSQKDLDSMKEGVRQALARKGIANEGVYAFSLRKNAPFDRDQILEYLQSLDQGKSRSEFSWHFKKLFVECKSYYDEEIHRESLHLSKLNKASTLVGDNEIVASELSDLVKQVKFRIVSLKETLQKLVDLKKEFFSEIKVISDKVGIQMPEPSEIDLAKESSKGALSIVKNLLRKKNLPEQGMLAQALCEEMKSAKPAFEEAVGADNRRQLVLEQLGGQIRMLLEAGEQSWSSEGKR